MDVMRRGHHQPMDDYARGHSYCCRRWSTTPPARGRRRAARVVASGRPPPPPPPPPLFSFVVAAGLLMSHPVPLLLPCAAPARARRSPPSTGVDSSTARRGGLID